MEQMNDDLEGARAAIGLLRGELKALVGHPSHHPSHRCCHPQVPPCPSHCHSLSPPPPSPPHHLVPPPVHTCLPDQQEHTHQVEPPLPAPLVSLPKPPPPPQHHSLLGLHERLRQTLIAHRSAVVRPSFVPNAVVPNCVPPSPPPPVVPPPSAAPLHLQTPVPPLACILSIDIENHIVGTPTWAV